MTLEESIKEDSEKIFQLQDHLEISHRDWSVLEAELVQLSKGCNMAIDILEKTRGSLQDLVQSVQELQ